MTIVYMGNVPLQVPESGLVGFINELEQQMCSMILHLANRCLQESLKTEVYRILGCKEYIRRPRAERKEIRGKESDNFFLIVFGCARAFIRTFSITSFDPVLALFAMMYSFSIEYQVSEWPNDSARQPSFCCRQRGA